MLNSILVRMTLKEEHFLAAKALIELEKQKEEKITVGDCLKTICHALIYM